MLSQIHQFETAFRPLVTFCGQLCAWAHTVAILTKAAIATLEFVALQVKDNIVCRVLRKNTTDWLAYDPFHSHYAMPVWKGHQML